MTFKRSQGQVSLHEKRPVTLLRHCGSHSVPEEKRPSVLLLLGCTWNYPWWSPGPFPYMLLAPLLFSPCHNMNLRSWLFYLEFHHSFACSHHRPPASLMGHSLPSPSWYNELFTLCVCGVSLCHLSIPYSAWDRALPRVNTVSTFTDLNQIINIILSLSGLAPFTLSSAPLSA